MGDLGDISSFTSEIVASKHHHHFSRCFSLEHPSIGIGTCFELEPALFQAAILEPLLLPLELVICTVAEVWKTWAQGCLER